MRSSAQYKIGSPAWIKAKCHEGDCQGTAGPDHSTRADVIKANHSGIEDDALVVHVLAGHCGPECVNAWPMVARL